VQGAALVGLVAATNVSAATCVGIAYGLAGVWSVSVNRVRHVSLRRAAPVNSWMLLATIATQIQSTADVVIVGALVDAKTAGLLAALYRFPNAWYLLQSVGASTFGAYAARSKSASATDYRQLQHRSRSIANRLALLPVASTPIVLLVAGPVLNIDLQTASTTALVVMMLTSAVITSNTPVNSFVALQDNDRQYARVVTTAAATNVALNLLLVSWGGISAAAVVTLGTTCLFGIMLRRQLRGSATA
jgi:O-antigen/teichoic acid export membrane protein